MPTYNNATEIRGVVEHRGIPFLLHFTLARNLPNIVDYGIRPRVELDTAEFVAYTNSGHPLSGMDKVVSTSISTISDNIFRAKIKGTDPRDWIVLFIDPRVLWTKHCLFCFRSAATKAIRNHRGRRDGPWAFEQMFSNEHAPSLFKGSHYREDTGIPQFITTDPDAEVQVIEGLEPEHVMGVLTPRSDLMHFIREQLDRLPGESREVLLDDLCRWSNGYSSWIIPAMMAPKMT